VRNYVSLRLSIALVTVITSPFILTHTIGIINAVQNATEPEPLKLTDEQIKDALTHLPGWSVVNGKIQKTFAFENFPTLFDFMFKVANLSQVISHHPNMTSTFNTLTLDYATWRIGHAISDLDINAANRVEMLYDNGNYTSK
jgi:4a-hydroxytetrahydrobiopterin dehydratase